MPDSEVVPIGERRFTGGGLFRTADGGQSWSRAASLLGCVPIYSLASATAADRVFLRPGTTGS